jgi:ParB family transcriptional regulator, chromosome partitioning protein
MSKIKPVLGRGLDALMNPNAIVDQGPVHPPDYSNIKDDDGKLVDILAKISVEFISPNPYQPRMAFEPKALEELKKSILSNGLIQPITVRRIQGNRYQLISGERRLRAYRDIGYKEIPAYIIKVESDEILLALALIENIQRERLNPIEIGRAYKRLMDECHFTQEDIAERVGKDRTTIANSVRLLRLPKKIQDALISGDITSGHARALININSETVQIQILDKILKNGLSVRKVEQLVKKVTEEVSPDKKSFLLPGTNRLASSNFKDIEDKLRRIFGTKVILSQKKDGSGEITIEFYTNDELERLFELFEIIDKNYN